jgi:hypothetical protein
MEPRQLVRSRHGLKPDAHGGSRRDGSYRITSMSGCDRSVTASWQVPHGLTSPDAAPCIIHLSASLGQRIRCATANAADSRRVLSRPGTTDLLLCESCATMRRRVFRSVERETRARSSADRAGGFGPSGRGFDSCRARHSNLLWQLRRESQQSRVALRQLSPLSGRHACMKRFAITVCGCLLVGCNAPTPEPALRFVLAPAPPIAVQRALSDGARIEFRPLTAMEVHQVRVSADIARQIALSEPGMGYGPGDDLVRWDKVGCGFLGWYTGPGMPRVGYVPPSHPAYLVQTLADPVPRFRMINIGVTVIDARTGETGMHTGGGAPPFGIMGTTCGVTP